MDELKWDNSSDVILATRPKAPFRAALLKLETPRPITNVVRLCEARLCTFVHLQNPIFTYIFHYPAIRFSTIEEDIPTAARYYRFTCLSSLQIF